MMTFARFCDTRLVQSSLATAQTHHHLELHRRTKRERRDASCSPSVASVLPQNLHEQIGGTVDHRRVLREGGGRSHEADELVDPNNLV